MAAALCGASAAAFAATYTQLTGASNPLASFGATVAGPASFVAADFDGDGKKDLVGRNPANTGVVYWKNNGNGTWTQLTGAANPFNGISFAASAGNFTRLNLAVIDVDGDGDIDIYNNALNEFWRNNGDGTFTALTGASNPLNGFGATIAGAASFVAIDFNGDGFTDLIGRSPTNDSIVCWKNNGNGTWTQLTGAANPFNGFSFTAAAASFTATNVAVLDVDGDGDLDIFNNGLNEFWRNNGDGTFSQLSGASNPLSGFGATVDGANSWTAGDFTGDGRVDLVGRVAADNAVVCWQNNGNGTWTQLTGASNPFNGVSFTAATANFILTNVEVLDIDSDGDIDLFDNALNEFWSASGTAPTLSSSTPADGAINISPTTNLTLTFSQAVSLGTGGSVTTNTVGPGDVGFFNGNTGTLIERLNVVSNAARFSGGGTTSITIDPTTSGFPAGTPIYVLIGTRAFVSTATGLAYEGLAHPQALSFTILPNTTPSFNDGATQTLTVNEDASATSITSLLDVVDPDNSQTLTWSVATSPTKGTLNGFTTTAATAGNSTPITPTGLTYTPTANQNGSDSFVIQVSDGTATDTITVNVTITAIADTPSVTGATTNEDTQTTSGLVISRNAVDGAEVTHFKITAITGGTLFQNNGTTAINNNDVITFAQGNAGLKFTPTANASTAAGGTFSFAVQGATSAGGAGLSSAATATITVTAIADTPSVTSASTSEDTQTTSGLVISRNAADGAEVTHFKITAITGGTLFQNNGTTAINNNDVITFAQGNAGLRFTPAANANTPAGDTFSFVVQGATSAGGAGLGSGATATITVSEVNDAPTAAADALTSVAEDSGQRTIAFATLLANDTTGPANESGQSLTIISVGSAVGGTVSISGGNVLFTPTADFNGTASFSYTAQDNGTTNGVSDPKTASATASFSVTAVADTPSVTGATTAEDTQTASGLVLSRNAADGTEVTHFRITAITGGTLFQNNGTTVINNGDVITFAQGNAGLKFTPAANANTPAGDTFSFDVQGATSAGGAGLSTATTATITVTEVNDAPTAAADALTSVAEDSGQRTITFASLLANDTTGPANESSQTLTITAVGSAVGGAVSISGTDVLFTPAANFNGAASFSYTAQDNGTTNGAADPKTANATVSFTVTAVADPPSVTGATTAEDTQSASGLVISRNAVDGAEVTHFRISAITGGTLFLNDGTTAISNGDVITFAQGNAGLKFTPAADANTPAGDTFSFDVQGATSAGGAGLSTATTATITVTEVNDAPTAAADALTSVAEDSGQRTITFASLLANDTTGPANESGQTLTITAVGSAVGGAVSISGTDVLFTPTANFNGAASFSYTAQDNGTTNGAADPKTANATVSFNVTAVADTPSVTGATTNEDTQTTSGLVISRNAVDGVEVTHFKITAITGGTLFQNDGTTAISNGDVITFAQGNAGLKFTPAANANTAAGGTFSFDVQGATSAGGAGLSGATTATITVTSVADAPAVTAATTTEDTQSASGLVLSRNAADGADVTHFKITAITGGTLFQNDGTTAISNNDVITFAQGNAGLKFTPAANANTAAGDTFSFAVQGATSAGGAGLSSATTATITVTEVNDAPTAAADALSSVAEDSGQRTIAFATLLANDTAGAANESGQTLTITAVGSAVGGTVSISGSNVLFTPTADFNGAASFSYTVQDNGTTNGAADPKTASATASFTITEVNDAPIAVADTLGSVAEDSGQRTIAFATLLANDSAGPADESGQSLTIIAVGSAVGGTVSISGSNVLFTPTADFNGAASFSYTVQDNGTTNGAADPKTASATASFTITEVNDAPTAVADTLSDILEDSGQRTIAFATLLANDAKGPPNESGQTLTIISVGSAVGGAVSISGSNVLFTPTADFNGAASFSYTVQDDGTTNGAADPKTSSATVSFNILPTAEPPGITPATTAEDTQTTSGLVISRNAADGPEITHFKITAITGGTLFQNDGTTAINNGDFITFAQGNAGLKFTPALNANTPAGGVFSFAAQGATDNVGGGLGGATTGTITVTAVNDAPVATTTGGTTAYTEGNNTTATLAVDPGITVSDVDNATLASGTVAITANFQAGQDVLAFTNDGATMGNVAGSYNAGTGVLTLTSGGATATLAQWQAALRAVTYADTSETPNTTTRTITFVVNDGALDSAGATQAVSVTAVNDTPVVTTTGGVTAFVEANGGASTPVTVDAGLTVSDADTATLASASVTITGNLVNTEDVLAFTNDGATMADIAGAYTSATGVLALTSAGTPTVAQWQAALRAVQYTNSSETPNAASRAVSFVVNDGNSSSAAATKTVSVTPVNDTPTLTTIGTLATATEDTPFTIAYATLAAAANEADADGDPLSFRVEAVSSGTLTKGGVTVTPGVTLLAAGESFVWTPAANANGTLNAFTVKAWDGAAASVTAVQVQVTTAAVADTPSVTGASTFLNTQTSSGLVITRNAADGAEVTHFKITAITGGTLFQNNGTTPIANNDFITVAQGGAGLKFTPAPGAHNGSGGPFTFTVQASLASNDGGLGGATATASISVLAFPIITSPTTAGGVFGAAFSYTITATNSPTSFSATGLPVGLTLDSGTGVISGSLSAATVYNIVLGATNNAGASPPVTLVLTVAPAPVAITLSNTTQTYNGTPRSVTATTIPSGVAVTLTYDGSFTAPSAAGTYAVSTIVTDPNFSGSTSGTLTIEKAAQTITFNPPGAVTIGVPVALSASASSGLPVTIAVLSGPATISGGQLTASAVGDVVLRLSQAGDSNYLPVSVDRPLGEIGKRPQTIAFAALADRAADSPPFQLEATATSGLPVSFALVSGPAVLTGTTLSLTGDAGSVTIAASQPGDATYQAAPVVTRSFEVEAVGLRVFIGDVNADAGGKVGDVGAVLPPGANAGNLLFVAPSLNLGLAFAFTLQSDGTFVATTTVDTAGAIAGAAAAARTFTVRGRLAGNVLSGHFDELALGFAVPVQSTGATAAVAGYYPGTLINSASGFVYTLIGKGGEVIVVPALSEPITGGRTSLDATGNFVWSGTGVTIRAAVDGATMSVSGVIVRPDRPDLRFTGLAASVARTDRLVNLSSRARVGPSGDRTLITGFVIGGTQPQRVLLRAIGPALAAYGVTGVLSNPRLQLYDGQAHLLFENDDWSGSDTAQAITQTGAFALSVGAHDAALVVTLAPGSYTMHVIDGGETGIALAEIYDASTDGGGYQRLINVSSRGTVDSGDGVLVGGFVVTGNAPKRILIRGAGPALVRYGVTGALADPKLTVFSGQTVVARNDDWGTPQPIDNGQTTAGAAEISAAALASGAFAFDSGSKDAALVITLAPGAYTAQVASGTGASGVALVEVYELPP